MGMRCMGSPMEKSAEITRNHHFGRLVAARLE
jgi:hypothetical protein